MKPSKISPRLRALVLAGALGLGLPAQAPLAQVRLPALGDEAGEEFSIGTERSLGEQIMREIRRDPDYLDDPTLLDYLQGVWLPLLQAAQSRGEITAQNATQLAWEAFLVRDRSVNAFALPGGYVGVHLGLIAMTASSDELAAVLAHELSHVTQRHIARGIVNSQRTTMLSLAGLILGMLAASRTGSADATQAVIVGSQAAAAQGQLNYSRDMEREADRVGYGVLTEAGYSPAGMSAMFEKLENANRLNDSGAFPYLRSHPLTVDRISEARARLMQSGGGPVANPLYHQLMAARARVLMDTSEPNLRRLADRLRDDAALAALPFNERLAVLYAGAMSAALLRDNPSADAATAKSLELLRGAAPGSPSAERSFALLRAQVLVQRGQAARALQLLDAASMQPATRATLLVRAQAALVQWQGGAADGPRELQRSSEALQSWLAIHRQDPLAWEALAQVEDGQGQRLRAMRAQAEVRAALGDLTGAIDRLRAAQALARSSGANDFIEASVIDSRLRDLQNQRRILAAELRGKSGQKSGQPPE